jgi:hypothetical protein
VRNGTPYFRNIVRCSRSRQEPTRSVTIPRTSKMWWWLRATATNLHSQFGYRPCHMFRQCMVHARSPKSSPPPASQKCIRSFLEKDPRDANSQIKQIGLTYLQLRQDLSSTSRYVKNRQACLKIYFIDD